MKISNSKKELARIISENGGWRNGEFAAQDGDGGVGGYEVKPEWDSLAKYWWREALGGWFLVNKIKNHHQTVLSRAEYFHLYPMPDADGWIEWQGGECPVDEGTLIDVRYRDGHEQVGCKCGVWGDELYATSYWLNSGGNSNIIAYRLHKPEQSTVESRLADAVDIVKSAVPALMRDDMKFTGDEAMGERKPTIEQLAADYRNAKDYADRKQQEADDAKVDADEKLRVLEIAGEALSLLVSPITEKQDPEVVIAVQVGDEVECIKSNINPGKYMGRIGTVSSVDVDGSSTPYLVEFGGGAKIWCHEVKFIRRP